MISGHDTNAISLNKKIHLIFFNNISFLPPPPPPSPQSGRHMCMTS